MSRYLSRKDVAQQLEISVDSVKNNEIRLGLKATRRDINPRLIRYDRIAAERALRQRKVIK